MPVPAYKPWLWSIVFILNFKAHSQNPFLAYLNQSTGNSTLTYDSIINYYSTERLHQPIIPRLSLRTETDEFKLNQQEYSIRAQTGSFSHNKLQNNINKLNKEEWQIRKRKQIAEQLYKKYNNIVKLVGLSLKIKAQKDYISSIVKQLELLNLKSGTGSNVNFEKHLDINLKLLNAKSDLEDLTIKLNTVQDEIKINQDIDSQFVQFISNEQIVAISNEAYDPKSQTYHALLENNLSKQQFEFKQDIKDANKPLDYIQIHYHDDPIDLVNQKLTLGAGFRIPMMNSNKKIKDEYELKRLNLNMDYFEENEKAIRELADLKYQMKRKQTLFSNLEANRQFILQKFNPETWALQELADPVFIAEIRFQLSKINCDLATTRADILNLYVHYLFSSGRLFQKPELYYLEYPFTEF